MKRFTSTTIIGSALPLLVAGQLFFSSGEQTRETDFRKLDGTATQLDGLDCVSKKLFFPKPPEKDEPASPGLTNNGD